MAPPKKKAKTNEQEASWRRELKDPSAPVVVVENKSDTALPVLDITSESLFANMIHPIPPADFMDSCFRQKALHIASSKDRIQPIIDAMDDLDPSFILQETSSDNVFVWILDKEQHKIQSVEIDNVDTAIALHSAGHATYCRAPPQVEQPMVANLLRGTGMGCGNYDPSGNSGISMGHGEVEVFMGTSQHTTDWHFDFQENFTLQLSGVKKWTLQQGTVQHPLRGCTPHYKAPSVVESQLKAAHLSDEKFQFGTPQVGVNAVGNVVEVVVKPGDMLYFPAGMWHKVETVEPGVSINVSLMATNYATLVSQALQQYLLTKDEWRESVVSSNGGTALSHMQQLLSQLPSEIEKLTNEMGFAQQILPPVIRNPPRLELVNENDHGEEENVVEQEEESPAVLNVMAEHNGAVDMDREVEEGIEEDIDEEVVDVNDFELPQDHPLTSLNSSGNLVVSSLALLLKMSDVVSFYSEKDEKENGQSAALYVLNVNYAGNEMHESTVRVVLKDKHGHLEDYVDGKPRDTIVCPHGVTEPWQECILYYGFFVWVPTNDSSTTS